MQAHPATVFPNDSSPYWSFEIMDTESWLKPSNRGFRDVVIANRTQHLWLTNCTSFSALEEIDRTRMRKSSPLQKVRRVQLSVCGHLAKEPTPCLEWDVLTAGVEGKRRREQPPIRWLDSICTVTRLTKQGTVDRSSWRRRIDVRSSFPGLSADDDGDNY